MYLVGLLRGQCPSVPGDAFQNPVDTATILGNTNAMSHEPTVPDNKTSASEPAAEGTSSKGQIVGPAEAKTTLQPAVPSSGRRQAFRDIQRQLDEQDMTSRGVQKLLLEELERSDSECQNLREYVELFHEADKRAAVLEERLKSNRYADVMFAVCLTIGGASIGWASALWDSSSKGPIALTFGIILVAGSAIGKVVIKG